MKKIFTLTIGVLSLSAVFAQRYDNRYSEHMYQSSAPVIVERGYEAQNSEYMDGHDRMHRIIERINWRYNSRIERVQNNYYINPWEKQRIIERLEMQKHNDIREVIERFHGEMNEGY